MSRFVNRIPHTIFALLAILVPLLLSILCFAADARADGGIFRSPDDMGYIGPENAEVWDREIGALNTSDLVSRVAMPIWKAMSDKAMVMALIAQEKNLAELERLLRVRKNALQSRYCTPFDQLNSRGVWLLEEQIRRVSNVRNFVTIVLKSEKPTVRRLLIEDIRRELKELYDRTYETTEAVKYSYWLLGQKEMLGHCSK